MAKAKTKSNPFDAHHKILRDKQKELLETLARDRAASAEQPEDGTQDLADKAVSAYSKELSFSLSDAERETLVLIDEAIERIDTGDFGVCTNCGSRIGEKRLKAIPWTPFCIDCAELSENGMLQAAQ
ncbi:MAG TPA: TraR/DksA family transcriptional regulator [Thermoanaerobaculia bacterium]|nr:TraR/DksA family transcriptional regulator [Thermoanaerobaculia bacterium]